MRVAVIVTGALRTIKSTARFLLDNVARPNDAHVFACVQNDTSAPDEEWTTWLKSTLGPHLQSVHWYAEHTHTEWPALQARLVASLPVPDGWKRYLTNSGSMLEYYQLYLAYLTLCDAEKASGAPYDFVVRVRTDSIFATPVDFRWLRWSDEECRARWDRVAALLTDGGDGGNGDGNDTPPPATNAVLEAFMATLLSDASARNVRNLVQGFSVTENVAVPISRDTVHSYLHTGRYILTFRRNNLYVVRRSLFSLIPTALALAYGTFHTPVRPSEAPYWFNAENQFQGACRAAGLDIFDYDTDLENSSVALAHDWRQDMFFTDTGNIRHPSMVYCVVRRPLTEK